MRRLCGWLLGVVVLAGCAEQLPVRQAQRVFLPVVVAPGPFVCPWAAAVQCADDVTLIERTEWAVRTVVMANGSDRERQRFEGWLAKRPAWSLVTPEPPK